MSYRLILTHLKFKNWPFALKLSVIICLIVLIVITAISINSYQLYKKSMQEQVEEFVPRMLAQINRNLDDYVNEMLTVYRTILSPPYNQFLNGFFNNSQEGGNERDILHTFKLNQSLVGVVLYTASGSAYVRSAEAASWMDATYEKEPWFQELQSEKEEPSVLGIIRQQYVVNQPYTFSIAQPIHDAQGKIAGVLMLLGSLEAVKQIVQQIDFGEGASIDIVDRHDRIVYSSGSDKTGSLWQPLEGLFPDKTKADSGSQLVSVGDKDYVISYDSSSNSRWKVVSTIPLDNLSKRAGTAQSRFAIWSLAGFAAAAIIISLISYGMTNQLRLLSRQLQPESDLLPEELSGAERRDEIGHLSKAFRDMKYRIHKLDKEVLEAKLLRREAEIQALHSQMNPHFFYNVLETIRMTLVRKQPEKAEEALIALGQLVRYQAAKMADMVPVHQELSFISNLLSIQKLRFGDRLHVDYHIDPESLDCHIPGFLIQPLVENALKHGISDYDFTLQIVVRVQRDESDLVIHVIDEGMGMTPERLEHVLHAMREDGTADNRIGLTNVYQRIALLYGGRGEIHIESAEGSGTIVMIRVPAQHPSDGGKMKDEHLDC